jgi:hypothetical protein
MDDARSGNPAFDAAPSEIIKKIFEDQIARADMAHLGCFLKIIYALVHGKVLPESAAEQLQFAVDTRRAGSSASRIG